MKPIDSQTDEDTKPPCGSDELLRITKSILDFCLSEESTELNSLSAELLCDKMVQVLSAKAVYNIILELASDSWNMIEQKRFASSATLLRSQFEYFIELLFLAKHPENYKQRELDAKREQQKILNAIGKSKHPSLAKFKTDSKFEPRKSELNNDLKEHHPKSIWDLCDEVEYNWMYDMVYRCLSPVAHPSIVNYSNRYFKSDPSRQMLEYLPDPQLDEETAIRRLVLVSNILVNATSCIHKLLSESNVSAIDKQLEKFVRELKKATPR
jgi:hypothetical protein